ncbi:endonuclease Q family protein [Filobacillus milosensis]|uniref:endonuclease Q family protein n=1 Tax=Filobacillus milosensis TaxID=94137 RepID=UPI001E298E6E|nr:endonuclease Q family protein [Filobacillus milosensis]
MTLKSYYADLHVHIGRTIHNQPVKISASNNLTITNIFHYVREKKGLDLVGVIDTHVPEVIEEIDQLLESGECKELDGGGISNGSVTLLLGSEIELYDDNCSGPIHVLCFLPTLKRMRQFSEWYAQFVKNRTLSSQRMYIQAKELQKKVAEFGGLFIPAHVFTPFKSLYGKGVNKSLTEVFDPNLIDAVELGLSSDTSMADTIDELNAYTFLTNSDSHSLEKIGREYQELGLAEPTFEELKKALKSDQGRCVKANYGMNPRLGKYYTTICRSCDSRIDYAVPCPECGSKKVVKGVSERILEVSGKQQYSPNINRPPYIYQVPLEYIPGLGPKTLERLRKRLYNDMYIIHQATFEELIDNSNKQVAELILQLRHGKLGIEPGGGGTYGRVVVSPPKND